MPAPDWLTTQPVAHRGLHDRARGIIENTPSAALAAIVGNFSIECDIQLTADGEDRADTRAARALRPLRRSDDLGGLLAVGSDPAGPSVGGIRALEVAGPMSDL